MVNKRGQVTMFIIVAIIVVALAALFYAISPKLGIDLSPSAKNPEAFIETCLKDDLKEIVEQISLQGGSLDPEFYFTFNNIPIEYLCYTNQAYVECVIQQPLLQSHIERELENSLQDLSDFCFDSLRKNYEEQGYVVDIRQGLINVQLLPKRIISNLKQLISLQ